jgi:hypothetical protein
MNIILVTAIGWAGGIVMTVFLLMFLMFRYGNKYVADNNDCRKKAKQLLTLFLTGLIILVIAIVLYFNFTAVGKQQIQAWQAQSVGIQREVEVYSMTGELIAKYSGVYNIEYDTERVEIYDTVKHERIIIYYKNGTIIVTEKGE